MEMRQNLKIHYHSQLWYFGGSEEMMPKIWSHLNNHQDFKISFSYRYSSAYTSKLIKKLVFPVNLYKFGFNYPNILNSKNQRPLKFSFFNSRVNLFFSILFEYITFPLSILFSYRLISKLNPDIVHVNNGGYPGSHGALAFAIGSRLAGCKKVILVTNNIAKSRFKNLERILDIAIDLMIRFSVNTFVTASETGMYNLSKVLYLPAQRCIVIPNTCNADTSTTLSQVERDFFLTELQRLSNSFIFGNFSQLIERKGIHDFILGIHELKNIDEEAFLNSFFVIVGNGDQEIYLKELSKRLKVETNILFIPESSFYREIMKMCDIVVLTSRENEDLPIVLLDALSLGKPLVGTRVGGISEIVQHNQNGYLISPADTSQLAKYFSKLYHDRFKLDQFSAFSEDLFNRKYSSEIVLNQYIQLYKNI